MREYKFRAWDKTGPCMIGPYDIDDAIWNHKEIRQLPLTQFTGLKDKNGKEIYEGDKIDCSEYDPNQQCVIKRFFDAVVGHEKGSYYYYPEGNMRQPHQLLMYAYDAEVIGNVFQNKELLES